MYEMCNVQLSQVMISEVVWVVGGSAVTFGGW